jgi:NADPH:quinone reductase-like Zn-dependent oxidoreductase
MKAARIHQFGPPDVIVIDELRKPLPGKGEVLVRVVAAGVGPWDALIRERKSVVSAPLPLTLGSDLSGIVEEVGDSVTNLRTGDEVFGGTNPQFIGAYADFAVASAAMLAPKPLSLDFNVAASVPVVAVTAWQMLFEYALVKRGQSVLIHGAAGNVGAYAVQLASEAGLEIFATAAKTDFEYVRGLGAGTMIDSKSGRFEDAVPPVDVVLDMVGGEIQTRSFSALKPTGILVSVVSPPKPDRFPTSIRSAFFLVEVTSQRLHEIADRLGAETAPQPRPYLLNNFPASIPTALCSADCWGIWPLGVR